MTDEHLHQRVLDVIQSGFPISSDPYGELAASLGAGAGEVRAVVAQLREDGTVRRIGASFDSRKLGYTSTLCALAAPEGKLEEIAAQVGAFPQVTHNYERNGRYNLWFTLITRTPEEKQAVLDTLGGDILDLPATHLFKIRVDFSAAARKSSKTMPVVCDSGKAAPPFDADDPADVTLVRWAQGDVGDELEFADPSHIARLRELRADGTIRRFGAIVRHRKLGYAVNAMTVWNIDDADIARTGAVLASNVAVSHCYARARAKSWPYNLYAMVHAKTDAELEAAIADLGRALETAGVPVRGQAALKTIREFKKTSMRYFE